MGLKQLIHTLIPCNMNHETFLDEYKQCIDYIREQLRDLTRYCEQTRHSIKYENMLFQYGLQKAKKEAFSKINTMNKPYIVYRVNKYYSL